MTHTGPVDSQHTHPTIALFVPRFDQGYIDTIWKGVTDTAREHDFNLICFVGGVLRTSDTLEAQRNILYDLADVNNLDGIIVVGTVFIYMTSEEQAQFFERYRSVPKICISSPVAGIPIAVVADDYTGIEKLLHHLIDTHSCRRIAFIRGPETNLDAEKRYRAYIDVLAAHHIPFNPDFVVTGNFQKESGSVAIDILLDKRNLRPGTDIDAVVSSNDHMAIGALKALHARGFNVPDDLVVTGFDNIEEVKFTKPPLTTVHQPIYEMGRRAVELLLAQFQGEDPSDREVLPTKLVVRQSCRCLASEVVQAGTEPAIGRRGESLETEFTIPRETVIAEMAQAVGGDEDVLGWAESLLNGVITEEQGSSSGAFVSAIYDVLQQVAEAGGEIMKWQNAISVLWRHVLPSLGKDERESRAKSFWQQARIVIGEMAQRVEGERRLQAGQRTATVNDIGQALMISFDIEKLMDVLAQELPRLNIPGCYLALYDNPQPYKYPQPVPPWSHLIMAYNEQGRITLEPRGRRFPSRQLLPKGSFPQGRSYSMVMLSLHFQEEQIGFVLFEIGPQEGTLYDILRGEISSALEGALLVQRVQERSAEIARQKYILDTFMANVPDSIYFKNRDSCFIRANRSLAALFGVTEPAQLIGKSDFDFFSDEEARPKYEQEQEIIQTGQAINLEEPDTRGRWSLTTKMPLRNEHGEIIGTFGISRDITELKQAQQDLKNAYLEISNLNEQLNEENMRMSMELDVARRLQEMILPSPEELQQIPGLEIVGYMQPADEVGGDYYDVLKENGMIHIGIGDVTGHGLESGVLMLMTQTVIRTLIEHGEVDPVSFVNTLNRTIYKNVRRMGTDKTLTFALVKYQNGHLKIVGQHEEMLVVRQDGQIERVDTLGLGFPIGLEENIAQWVNAATISLQPGDGIVLYTDGITEAANLNSELYGLDRLCEIISQNWHRSTEELKQVVMDDVIHYIGKQKIYDDLTLVVLKQK
jgi:PAS domain S-box-containing protein